MRNATRAGDRLGDCDLALARVGDASNGFGRPLYLFTDAFPGDLSGVLEAPAFPGETLRPPLCGGMAFGGDNGIVGFKIDLTKDGRASCIHD